MKLWGLLSGTRRLAAAFLPACALCLAVAGPTAVRASEPATRVVEELHQVLEEHLGTPALTFDARLKRLEPVVADSFDFDAITRVALGPAWVDMDPEVRARFTAMMRRLSALTYADRFAASDSRVRFVTLSSEPARRGRILVRTRLERDTGDPVTLDYVLADTPDGPRIVNVLADGVSDLSLKRAEYAAVIRKVGVDGLERRLLEQLDSLAAQGTTSRSGS